MNAQENDNGRGEAQAQLDTIIELVTALDCDFDRLSELKEEREDLSKKVTALTSCLGISGSDADAAELAEAMEEVRVWDADYGDELKDLLEEAGEFNDRDEVMERIQEEPLEIQVRGGWRSPGDESEDEEFYILLSTGGPACRIIGELSDGQVQSARLQYQDWFTPWTELITTGDGHDALETFCSQFYFGE